MEQEIFLPKDAKVKREIESKIWQKIFESLGL